MQIPFAWHPGQLEKLQAAAMEVAAVQAKQLGRRRGVMKVTDCLLTCTILLTGAIASTPNSKRKSGLDTCFTVTYSTTKTT